MIEQSSSVNSSIETDLNPKMLKKGFVPKEIIQIGMSKKYLKEVERLKEEKLKDLINNMKKRLDTMIFYNKSWEKETRDNDTTSSEIIGKEINYLEEIELAKIMKNDLKYVKNKADLKKYIFFLLKRSLDDSTGDFSNRDSLPPQ